MPDDSRNERDLAGGSRTETTMIESSTRRTNATQRLCFQVAQHFQCFGWVCSNRVIRVHVGCANDPLAIDDIPRWDRQAVFGLVMKSVEGISEGCIQLAQISGECKVEVKLLGDFEVKIGQDVES